MLTCKQCGGQFEPVTTQGQVAGYCDDDCRLAAKNERQRAARAKAKAERGPKSCEDCGLPLGYVHGNKKLCADCTRSRKRASDRAWLKANPGRAYENNKRWRAANPERRREQAREEARRERSTPEGRERSNARARKSYHANHEASLAKMAKYRASDRGKATIKAATKRWRDANPDRVKALARRTRLRRYGFESVLGSDGVSDAEILDRDGWACYLCEDGDSLLLHSATPTIDHVWPLARGGADTAENKRAAHKHCNSRKNSRLLIADDAGNIIGRTNKVTYEMAQQAGWHDRVGAISEEELAKVLGS